MSGSPRHHDFRWQSFFQRSTDALFVLNRHRRLRFVNRAWEALTGVPAADVYLLDCTRQQATDPGDPPREVLAHALCPPTEARAGEVAQARRLVPRADGPRWWDVDFFPLGDGQGIRGWLGRVRPMPAPTPEASALPEQALATRQRRRAHLRLDRMFDPSLPVPRRLAEQVRLAAGVAAPVLIAGEEGTGKRTLARLIHLGGPRRESNCAVLDCTRVPPAALGHVLFGEKADPLRRQLGMVVLHRPDRLPRELQQRLAERLRTGSWSGPRLCACAGPESGDLSPELREALSTLVIAVPPLRERMDELPRLVERLLPRAAARAGVTVRELSPPVWAVLRAHRWPGNVAELYAVLARSCAAASGPRLEVKDLPSGLRLAHAVAETPAAPPDRPWPLEELLARAERGLIEAALRKAEGNKTRAAKMLGLWRRQLYGRMKALGILPPEAEDVVPPEDIQVEEDPGGAP